MQFHLHRFSAFQNKRGEQYGALSGNHTFWPRCTYLSGYTSVNYKECNNKEKSWIWSIVMGPCNNVTVLFSHEHDKSNIHISENQVPSPCVATELKVHTTHLNSRTYPCYFSEVIALKLQLCFFPWIWRQQQDFHYDQKMHYNSTPLCLMILEVQAFLFFFP